MENVGMFPFFMSLSVTGLVTKLNKEQKNTLIFASSNGKQINPIFQEMESLFGNWGKFCKLNSMIHIFFFFNFNEETIALIFYSFH
jgi:hypothetical protein